MTKVLFLRFSSLGDIIVANKTAKRLKEEHPDWQLTWLTDKSFAPLVQCQPWVDNVLEWDRKNTGSRGFLKIIRKIRHLKFDILIDMHSTDRSCLLAFLSGIPTRCGVHYHLPFCHNVYGLDSFIDSSKSSNGKYLFSDHRALPYELKEIQESIRLIAIAVGASYEKKVWPVANIVEYIKKMSGENTSFVLLGSSQKEIADAEKIVAATKGLNIINLTGKTSLLSFVAAIDRIDLLVSPDTGASHVADALNKKVIVLFGPFYNELCRGIFKNQILAKCNNLGCENIHCPKQCMETITPEEVAELTFKLLDE